MDADINNLQRTVATLESHATSLLEMKKDLTARLRAVEVELADLLHARATIQGGIDAVVAEREEPHVQRH